MVRSPVSSRVVVAGLVDAGGDEGDLRVLLDGEEVVAAQVAVALLVAGVDAGGLDGQLRGGLGEVVGVDDGGALELVERAADLGDHRVPGDEPDAGVGRVDDVGAGQVGEGGGGDGAGVMPCSCDREVTSPIGDVSRIYKRNLGDMSTIPAYDALHDL